MTRKSSKHYARHTEPLGSFFDFIRFHQQCILWSLPQEIEPVITECRAEALPMSHRSPLHTSHIKLTSHGNYGANLPEVSCKLHPYSLQRTRSPPDGNLIYNIIPLLKKENVPNNRPAAFCTNSHISLFCAYSVW